MPEQEEEHEGIYYELTMSGIDLSLMLEALDQALNRHMVAPTELELKHWEQLSDWLKEQRDRIRHERDDSDTSNW